MSVVRILTILLILVIHWNNKEDPIHIFIKMEKSAIFTKQINPSIDPCENFYEFVCGNCKTTMNLVEELYQKAQWDIIDLFKDVSKSKEPRILRSMKRLFKECLREVVLDETVNRTEVNIAQVKKDIKYAGGWPCIEGPDWNEKKFNWTKATIKFREKGYYHQLLFDFSVVVIENKHEQKKQLLKISIPRFNYLAKEKMMQLALLFGADKEYASKEIDSMQQFFFQNQINGNENPDMLFSIEEYQKKQPTTLNWINFVQEIIKPTNISQKSVIIFPPAEQCTNWINLLSKIPKRILANYMMWNVVEKIVQDLHFPKYLSTNNQVPEKANDLICLQKIQQKFRPFPNPVDVLYINKYMTLNKLRAITELVDSVTKVFFDLIDSAKWLEIKGQDSTLGYIYNMSTNILISSPKLFRQNNTFEIMTVDLKKLSSNNFLSLLLAINRNYQSLLYKQIESTVSDSKSLLWNLLDATLKSLHYLYPNGIEIPATLLQGTFFDEYRPNYLNYGSLGTFIAAEISNQFIKLLLTENFEGFQTVRRFLTVRRCFLEQVMDNLNINGIKTEWDYKMMLQHLSTNISNAAYQMWVENNGIEPKNSGVSYTNKQLFWISAASFYCQHYIYTPTPFNTNPYYTFYVSAIGLNNRDFAKDFNCPVKSKVNPLKKCYIF